MEKFPHFGTLQTFFSIIHLNQNTLNCQCWQKSHNFLYKTKIWRQEKNISHYTVEGQNVENLSDAEQFHKIVE